MVKYGKLRERSPRAGNSSPRTSASRQRTDEEIKRAHCPRYLARMTSGKCFRGGEYEWRSVYRGRKPWSSARAARRVLRWPRAARRCAPVGPRTWRGAPTTRFAIGGRAIACSTTPPSPLAPSSGPPGCPACSSSDCDVHQGNGTASIFAGDDSVFTFSIHGAKNFPFEKVAGDLDIELPDGARTTSTCGTSSAGWARRSSARSPQLPSTSPAPTLRARPPRAPEAHEGWPRVSRRLRAGDLARPEDTRGHRHGRGLWT